MAKTIQKISQEAVKEINRKNTIERSKQANKELTGAVNSLQKAADKLAEDKEIEQMRKELREVSEYNEMLWRYGI